jgi:RNA polymerase sigma-70 factor (ECF subfamily)
VTSNLQAEQNEWLRVLYDRHAAKLYKFFYYKLLDKEEAEDLTTEVFIVVLQKQPGANVQNIEAFLYGIARNLFIKCLQRKYREASLPIEAAQFVEYVAEFVAQTSRQSPEERLIAVLPSLPASQREVLRLRLIEKLSIPEIAHYLGKNINYVKTTQNRALKTARQIIACIP